MHRIFREVWIWQRTDGHADIQTDRQTDRQTDTLIAILRTPASGGEVTRDGDGSTFHNQTRPATCWIKPNTTIYVAKLFWLIQHSTVDASCVTAIFPLVEKLRYVINVIVTFGYTVLQIKCVKFSQVITRLLPNSYTVTLVSCVSFSTQNTRTSPRESENKLTQRNQTNAQVDKFNASLCSYCKFSLSNIATARVTLSDLEQHQFRLIPNFTPKV